MPETIFTPKYYLRNYISIGVLLLLDVAQLLNIILTKPTEPMYYLAFVALTYVMIQTVYNLSKVIVFGKRIELINYFGNKRQIEYSSIKDIKDNFIRTKNGDIYIELKNINELELIFAELLKSGVVQSQQLKSEEDLKENEARISQLISFPIALVIDFILYETNLMPKVMHGQFMTLISLGVVYIVILQIVKKIRRAF